MRDDGKAPCPAADDGSDEEGDGGGDKVRLVFPPAGGPHAAALAEVARAFNRGDFRTARRLSREVLEAEQGTEEERAFAAQMARRTGVDPLALVIGGVALVVLVVAAATGVRC